MDNTFGITLRKLRVEKHLSQQQLAQKLYVDRSTIANWETGRRMPDASLISQISACLGVDVAYLLSTTTKQSDKPNVIMVDDEKIILTGGLPVLEQALPDVTINGFTKPSDAIEFAEKNKVALAFLDIEMGKMSGFELCNELLKLNPNTNVVFLTAYMDYSFDAWDTGACGFLLKPLSVEGVKKQISRLRYPLHGGDST